MAAEERKDMGLCYVVISASLSINDNVSSISANRVDLSPIPSVGLSVSLPVCVCVSRKCTVAKLLTGSRCRLGW